LQYLSKLPSFLRLHSISLSVCTTFCLPICPSVDKDCFYVFGYCK
jgi:hypothetical protein